MSDYRTPLDVTNLDWLREQPIRRSYDEVTEYIEDKIAKRNYFWRPRQLAVVLTPVLEEQLNSRAKAWVHGY